jgi:hypothetical protein
MAPAWRRRMPRRMAGSGARGSRTRRGVAVAPPRPLHATHHLPVPMQNSRPPPPHNQRTPPASTQPTQTTQPPHAAAPRLAAGGFEGGKQGQQPEQGQERAEQEQGRESLGVRAALAALKFYREGMVPLMQSTCRWGQGAAGARPAPGTTGARAARAGARQICVRAAPGRPPQATAVPAHPTTSPPHHPYAHSQPPSPPGLSPPAPSTALIHTAATAWPRAQC